MVTRTLTAALLTAVLFTCCKKHPEPACDTSKPFQPEFTVGEAIPGIGFVPTDTIVTFSFAAEAPQNYLSYSWKIGTDPTIFTGSKVSLTFTGAQAGQSIPVVLKAKGRGGECGTGAIQERSITKKVTVMYPRGFLHENLFVDSQLVTLPFLGVWQGSFNDNPADTFSVYIMNNGPLPTTGTTNSYGIRIYNLPQGCSGDALTGVCGFVAPTKEYYGYPLEASYKYFYSEDIGFKECCPRAKLEGSLANDDYNKIIVSCRFYSPAGEETKRQFTGFRK